MWTPAVAAVWETWRLTRWRLVLVPVVATFCGWLWSRYAGSFMSFVVLFSAASAMALSLPSFGAIPGFPLRKAFARPIRTSVLVAAPLCYVFAAAALSYLLPAALLRASTGAALPLIPAAAFIGALAVLVAGARWFTRDATGQTGLAVAAFVVAGTMLRLLNPFGSAGHPFAAKGTRATPELFVLSGKAYVALLLLMAAIYLGIVFAVGRQRHGEEELIGSDARANRPSRESGDILESIRDTCLQLFRWRCPVSSPAAAEIWFELQCYGIPVLAIGALLALCIPALVVWANSSRSAIPVVLAACTFAGPFLAGVGASIWNRRNLSASKVPAFEAMRPIGTANLIGLQVLVATVCIWIAWMLMGASLWLSLPSLADLHLSHSSTARALEVIRRYGLRLLSGFIVGFTSLATLIALLASARAYGSGRGSRLWLWALAVALYMIGGIVGVAQGWVDGVVIDVHSWALAAAIPAGAWIVLRRALAAGILTPRQLATAGIVWLLFAALALDLLHSSGWMNTPPAIAALLLASPILPLLAIGLAPLSLSAIRHP